MQILEIAKRSSLMVSFDLNYRAKLWGEAQAVKVLSEICCSANHDLERGDQAARIFWQT
jgi:sugar/nucleoside kinase (ribokinase family)